MFIIGRDHEMVSQLWDNSDMTNYGKTSSLTCGIMLLKIFKDFLVFNNDDHNCDITFKMAVFSPATENYVVYSEIGGNLRDGKLQGLDISPHTMCCWLGMSK